MNDFEDLDDLDDYDYEYEQEELKRDTWFALTDGQYGDYPGYDVDYDEFGF
jgi:hypothetical protein